jgi:RNA polymerase sigma factor (sigma-70 family)
MTTSQTSEFILHLRWAVLLRDGAGLTDGQLLEDYISRRDEMALAVLVHRHAPMVWGVCRRLLSHHDAEDAFQASFLVLVRRAASIVPRQMVVNWLYGVAHQTALNARATAARRKKWERQVTQMPEPTVTDQDLWGDLQHVLDEELSRLPDKYRAVIVLCDLEGKTRKETAQQLGVPEGTVAGRLARARVMLAKRLTQRGVALSGGALAVVLSQKMASAGVPTLVVSSTIKAASLFAAGQAAGVISVKVAALTEGVLKSMLLTKLRIASAVLLVAVLCGVAGLICQTTAAEQPKAQPATEKGDKQKHPADQTDKKQPADRTEKEMKQLQGIWIAESAQPQSAQFTTHESAPYMILTIKGNALQFEIRAEGDAVPTPRDEKFAIRYDLSKYLFAIDPTRDPKRLLTTSMEKEPEAFRWFPECGYEVTGNRLRIVANFIRGGFPDSFTATENRHVYTFRRATTDPRTTSGERKK